MKIIKNIFHLTSYLQYPFNLAALFFILRPYYDIFIKKNYETIFVNFNTALIFLGIAISFSTLQDTTKTQNKLSKQIWESQKKGKMFLIIISVLILFIFSAGFIGYFTTQSQILEELSLGLIVLGIGLISLLKTAIEMFENHRKN